MSQRQVIRELSARSHDLIIGCGERLSAGLQACPLSAPHNLYFAPVSEPTTWPMIRAAPVPPHSPYTHTRMRHCPPFYFMICPSRARSLTARGDRGGAQ
jgi:hypothetical protein